MQKIAVFWVSLISKHKRKAIVLMLIGTVFLLTLPPMIRELADAFSGGVRISAEIKTGMANSSEIYAEYTDSGGFHTIRMRPDGEYRYSALIPTDSYNPAIRVQFTSFSGNLAILDMFLLKTPFRTDIRTMAESTHFLLSPNNAIFFYDSKVYGYAEASPEVTVAYRSFEETAAQATSQPLRTVLLANLAALALLVGSACVPSRAYVRASARFRLTPSQSQGVARATLCLLGFGALHVIASFIPVFYVWWTQAQIYLVTIAITLYLSALVSSLYQPKPGSKLVKTRSLLAFLAPLLPAVLLLGLRYGIGFDYFYTYVPEYQKIAEGMPLEDNPLFWLLNRCLSLLGLSSNSLFFVCACITIFVIGVAIYKSGAHPIAAVLVYLLGGQYFFAYNYVNQCIAIALLFLGAVYLFEGKWYIYLALAVAAALFHSAVLVGFVLLPIYYINPHPYVSTAITGLLLLLVSPIRQLAINLVTMLQSYSYYLNEQSAYGYTQQYSAFFVSSLMPTLVTGIVFAKAAGKNRRYRTLFVCVLITAIINIVLLPIIPNAYRITYIFSASAIYFIPEILRLVQSTKKRIILAIAMILPMCAYSFFLEFVENYGVIVPYQSVLG